MVPPIFLINTKVEGLGSEFPGFPKEKRRIVVSSSVELIEATISKSIKNLCL